MRLVISYDPPDRFGLGDGWCVSDLDLPGTHREDRLLLWGVDLNDCEHFIRSL
jgi:hypothetical protein